MIYGKLETYFNIIDINLISEVIQRSYLENGALLYYLYGSRKDEKAGLEVIGHQKSRGFIQKRNHVVSRRLLGVTKNY